MKSPHIKFQPFSWSPNGRFISGAIRPGAKPSSPAVYDLETKTYFGTAELSRFVIPPFSPFPHWLPDSRQFVFAARDTSSGREGLFLADRELRQPQEILSDETIRFSDVAPDGRWIDFNRHMVEADIWLLTFDERP